MAFNIAIDGPAGAGKSTIARQIARNLSFVYVDTGAMYRAMALYILKRGIDPGDEAAVAAALNGVSVSLQYHGNEQQVLLNGQNVNPLIRTEEVGMTASQVAAYAAVRAKLLELQRQLASVQDVIMDGRDIGTAVLPQADVKIYLTADAHVRALRRFQELQEKQQVCDLAEIEADIVRRDDQDMHRAIAPLVQAKDAVVVDSSRMDIQQVVETITQLVLEKMH